MLFGTQNPLKLQGRDLNISYNRTNITFVKEYVYLGNKLLLNCNFEQVYKRASNWLGLPYSVQKHLNTDAATKIFKMMILLILMYSGPIKSTYTKIQNECLTSLTNRAKRLMKMTI